MQGFIFRIVSNLIYLDLELNFQDHFILGLKYSVHTFKILGSCPHHPQAWIRRHHLLPAEGQGPLQQDLGGQEEVLAYGDVFSGEIGFWGGVTAD